MRISARPASDARAGYCLLDGLIGLLVILAALLLASTLLIRMSEAVDSAAARLRGEIDAREEALR